MVSTQLKSISSEVAGVCRRHHVRRLSLFGSALRDELRPDSDVDLLVEFERGFTPSFFKLADLSDQLRPFFDGREIDLVLPGDLHWFIRDQVCDSPRAVYAA